VDAARAAAAAGADALIAQSVVGLLPLFAKMGTKKSVLVEQHGGPLGVAIAGASVHDTKLLAQTIDAVVIPRPDPREGHPEPLPGQGV
jgi:hypothetical protein